MYKLLEKISAIDEQRRTIEWGFVDLSGKRIGIGKDHADYAINYIRKHRKYGSRIPKHPDEVVAKFLKLTGSIRYFIENDEIGFTIAASVNSTQVSALRRMLFDEGDAVYFDVVDGKGDVLKSGKGFSNLVSTLKNMDLLEKILEDVTASLSMWLTPKGEEESLNEINHGVDATVRLAKLKGQEVDLSILDSDTINKNFYEFMKVSGYIRLYLSSFGDELDVSVGGKVTAIQLTKIGKLVREYSKFCWEIGNPYWQSGQGFRAFVDNLKNYKLLKEAVDYGAEVSGGWLKPDGTIESLTFMHHAEDAASKMKAFTGKRYANTHKTWLVLMKLKGYIAVDEDYPNESDISVGGKVTGAQLSTIKKIAKDNDNFYYSIYIKPGQVEHGEIYNDFVETLRVNMLIESKDMQSLLEKILEDTVDFNQQLKQVRTIEDIEKLVVTAEESNYSLYSKRNGSWIFSFNAVTNPRKVKYLLDSGKTGVCLFSNLYKVAKFILEKDIYKVKESSIDFPREDLDVAIWEKSGDTYILREEVKSKIIDLISKYPDKDLNEIAKEIHIVGSIGTNQYGDDADIDVHIIPKSIDEWSESNVNAVVIWFNKNREEFDGYVNGHPIEVYIQLDLNQDLMSDSCYSILDNKWLVGPKIVPIDLDPYEDFSHIADEIRNVVEDADVLFGELKRDVIDYEVIKIAMERMSGEDKERLLQKLEDKLNELEDDIEALYKKRGEWVDARHKASKPETPEQALKDVELAKKWRDTNAIFKFVNRYHYLKAISNLQKLLADEKVTPDEVDKIKSIMGV